MMAGSVTHYSSIILYTGPDQKDEAEAFIRELDDSGPNESPVVTGLVDLEQFNEAEAEHKHFYSNNPGVMYWQIVIDPKVKKVREEFAEHLR